MDKFEAKVIIISGWLKNKYAAQTTAEDTAEHAVKIAEEVIRLLEPSV